MVETQPGKIGRLLGGRYEILERIGHGGQAMVFRAHDQRLGRTVAVKILGAHVASDPDAVQRLEREARAAASLNSPHVVPVFDVGADEDGRPYLVMEYVPGGTLAAAVAGRLPLPAATIVEYGRQIAEGLAAAHATGLIHRDVNPHNVLMTPEGWLKVTDFGVAKVTGSVGLTQTGLILGTAVAMAPEQAQGRPATPASDVYGLGVLLFELATGRPPFIGEGVLDVVHQHVHAAPPPPRSLNPRLPVWLEALILRTLAKDPAARFPDGASIGAALVAGQEHEPAGADAGTVPPSPPQMPPSRPPRSTRHRQAEQSLAGTPEQMTVALRAAAARPEPAAPAGMRRLVLLMLACLVAALVLASLLVLPRDEGGRSAPSTPLVPGTEPPGQTVPGGGSSGAAIATSTPTTTPTATAVLPTATVVSPTATTAAQIVPPPAASTPTATATVAAATATQVQPTATSTPRPPTAVPPTATSIPPTATPIPPTPTPAAPTATATAPRPPTKPAASPPGGPVTLEDSLFVGGYRNPGESLYADSTGEQRSATWIYGGRSEYPAMSAAFRVEQLPAGPAQLTLVGMDAEGEGRMPIEVMVNDQVIFRGANPLADWRWSQATLVVPAGVLHAGENTLTIRSLSSDANFNAPPFFMLDAASFRWNG
jgi:serine/threonine-protein kinase